MFCKFVKWAHHNLGYSFFEQKGWQNFIKKLSWTHGKIRFLFSKKKATFGKKLIDTWQHWLGTKKK